MQSVLTKNHGLILQIYNSHRQKKSFWCKNIKSTVKSYKCVNLNGLQIVTDKRSHLGAKISNQQLNHTNALTWMVYK